MTVHRLILAGGSGQRLGGVGKAQLRIGNATLIDRVIERLGPADTPLLLSVGPRPAQPAERWIELADSSLPLGGPIAGVIAAALHLRDHPDPDDLMVSVAIDTPFLPRDYVSALVSALGPDKPAAFACWQGNAYPTNAIWRLSALSSLLGDPTLIPDSPRRLLADLGAVPVDWARSETEDPFANLNTLADLVRLGRRAQIALS